MEIITSFILTLVASLSSIISILLTYIKFKNIDRVVVLTLSISFGVLILISLKELIFISAIYLINEGYFILIILIPLIIYNLLNIGLKNTKLDNDLYRVGVLSFITLVIHNILEGIITFSSNYISIKIGIKVTIAMIIHNIVEGLLICIPIYYSIKSRGRAYLYTICAAVSELVGAILMYVLFKKYITLFIINILLYIVGSLMIIISIKEILPEIIKFKNIKLFMIGIILSLIILLL